MDCLPINADRHNGDSVSKFEMDQLSREGRNPVEMLSSAWNEVIPARDSGGAELGSCRTGRLTSERLSDMEIAEFKGKTCEKSPKG